MTHPFEALALLDRDGRSRGVEDDVVSLLGPIDLGDSIDSCNILSGMPVILVIVAVQVLVTFGKVSSHLSRPSEIGPVPYFLQHLLY